jgi:pantothenate synthetase
MMSFFHNPVGFEKGSDVKKYPSWKKNTGNWLK